jgi:hypothetical protein
VLDVLSEAENLDIRKQIFSDADIDEACEECKWDPQHVIRFFQWTRDYNEPHLAFGILLKIL